MLTDIVSENWDNAAVNGFDLLTWADDEIAADMIDCGGVEEDVNFEELLAAVKAVRASRVGACDAA